MAEPKLKCRACNKLKRPDEFFWSSRKRKPTKTCIACCHDPYKSRFMGEQIITDELILYYSQIRSLMTNINDAQAEAAAQGLPVDRPIKSLGDVWVSQMTEEAYSAIVQALINKASAGDVNAAKLLLEERHRRLGEPTKEGVEESFEALFNIPPLASGLDSE